MGRGYGGGVCGRRGRRVCLRSRGAGRRIRRQRDGSLDSGGGHRLRSRRDRRLRACRSSRRRVRKRRLGRRGHGRRSGNDRRGRGSRSRSRRRRRLARREQRQRIDIALLVVRQPDAEMHVRLGYLGLAARADGADHGSLGHGGSTRDANRSQVDEGDRVAEGRRDRHRATAARDGSCEGHDALGRRPHRGPGRGAHVHAAVLTRRVGSALRERERPQHGAVDGPCPRCRGRDRNRDRTHQQNDETPHRSSFVVRFANETTLAIADLVVNTGYKERS